MILILIFAATFLASACGTALVRRYALAREVLDVPSDRSSHRVPTPRGGGVAIVAAFLAGIIVLAGIGRIDLRMAVALLGSGLIVSAIGFIDDHKPTKARWRLLAHFLAAAWALVWLGGFPPITLLTHTVDLGLAGDVLALLAIVWLLNLFNFMDGIDGIASVEAIVVCLGAAALTPDQAGLAGQWIAPVTLALATLGFLIWNFPAARIFMGDAGSGFLGIMIGTLALRAMSLDSNQLWVWAILLGVFVVDSTVTLLRRLTRGDRVYEAHRTHAYQHAAVRMGTHVIVTTATGLITALWLLPWAFVTERRLMDGATACLIAYAPLVLAAVALKAGKPES